MSPRELAALLAANEGVPFGDWSDVRVNRITTDSRRVREGDLFVGLPGASHDGAGFALQALRAGASAVLLPLGAAPPRSARGLCHPDVFQALADAALRLYEDPGRDMGIVGVTGTNGKTTTSLLVAHLLSQAPGNPSYWTTTLVRLPETAFRPQWTTPPAHELQRFLRAARDQGSRLAVVEVSSHAVVQRRIAGLRFAAGVVTNFSADHLAFHGDARSYHEAKHRFIRGLQSDAAAVLNGDDPEVVAMGEDATTQVFTFGRAPEADVGVEDLRRTRAGISGQLALRRGELGEPGHYPFALPMVGTHNAMNAAAAFAVAVRLGVAPRAAAAALSRFPPPPRRLERIEVGPLTVVNDVAMNEASFETVLRTVAVHALRGNRGSEVNRRTAEIFGRWAEVMGFAPLIVTQSRWDLLAGDVDRRVRPDERDAFLAAAAEAGMAVSLHDELEEAIREAVDRLSPGGVLLLLGTFGMDRGPGLARTMLQARLGLRQDGGQDYLSPQDEAF